MSTVLANFLFEAVNLLVLAAALGYFFFKPVRSALDRERARRADAEAELARLRAEAEDLNAKAKDAWSAADADMAERRDRLLGAARGEAGQLKQKARDDRTAERQAFDKELRALRDTQTGELSEAVGQVAGASVRRLLESVDGPDLDTALVRVAVAELRGTPKAAGSLVMSARPLADAALAELSGVLGEGFSVRIDPELGAGVRVTTSAGQVDASAAGFARLAARDVKRNGRGAEGGDGD